MWGLQKNFGFTWLKQMFYARPDFIEGFREQSLTLSDLKKDEVLKLA
jgi:hypothetical protein